MKTKESKSEIKKYGGVTLEKPIPFAWTWQVFENVEEFITANVPLTAEEQMEFRNTQAEQKARSAADTAAKNAEIEAGRLVKQTAANNNQIAMQQMLKPMLVSLLPDGTRRFTDAEARAKVEETYGEKLAD